MTRPTCKVCLKNPVAPNYYKNGVRHWRTRCSVCIRKHKNLKPQVPRWQLEGYRKKLVCDLCGFKAQYSGQIVVYHIDGNLNNAAMVNLRSICLCCTETVKRRQVTWRQGDLQPD